MKKNIQYYFAPQSPFTYLGHERLMAIAARHGAHVEVRPVDLGKVFSVSGGLPLPKRSPQRQAYRLKELERWSEFLQKPMKTQPAFFPVAGDPAARLIIAAQLTHGSAKAASLTGAILKAVWEDDQNIADTTTLSGLAVAQGIDGNALLQAADTAGIQAEYERFTDEAIAANMFGAPWYVIDGEGFWGQDRLDFVERALQR